MPVKPIGFDETDDEYVARLEAEIARLDSALAATPASGDFSVLPGEDGNFALDQLQSAINDIDISAYNAAKWRIQKAITVLRAVVASPQTEWQPVETAPHEQRVLLGWWYDGLWISEVAEFSHGWRKGAISNMSHHGQATHWMPLPASPVSRPMQRGGEQ